MTLRSRLLWTLLGIGLVLFLLRPILPLDRTLVFRDAIPFAAAQNRVLRDATLDARLAEWDSSQYAGVPFLAGPPAQALYPPRLLAVVVASHPASANEVMVILHLLLALFGANLLGRELGLDEPSRRVAAVTYTLAGPTLSLLENLPSLAGACWLPLSLGLILRARRDPRPRALALAAAGLALPVYAGAVQTATWLVCLAIVLLLLPRGDDPPARRAARLLGLGAGTSLLAAALVLPALLLLPETDRTGLTYEEIGTWSFHPARLVELLIPFPLGVPFPSRAAYLGSAIEPRAGELWSHTLFVGAIPFLFALRALGSVPERLRPARKLLLVIGLVGLLLAFGRHTPLHPLLADRTPYGVFRYPEKHLALVVLALAGLAGIGLQAFRTGERTWRRLLPWLLVPAAAVVACIGAGVWSAGLAEDLGRETPELSGQAVATVLCQVAALAVLGVPGLSRRRRGAALVLLTALAALPVSSRLVFAGRADIATETPPAVAHLRNKVPALDDPLPPRVIRWPPGKFGRYPANLNQGEAITAVSVLTLEGATCSLHDLEGLHGMTGYRPRRVHRLLHEGDPARAAGRAAAPFVLGPAENAPRVAEDTGLGTVLYRLPARPRVEVVNGVHWVRDEESAWAALKEADLNTVVAVGSGEPSPRSRSAGALQARRPVPERIEIDVRAETDALIVVREAWFPGWSATVDGQPAQVVRVDGAFMGVRVPRGASRVTLSYDTPGLTLGLTLALVAWSLLALLVTGRLPGFRAAP